MRRALHISPNAYKSIDEHPSTKAIWMELSKDYDEYHILARSTDNLAHEYTQGKLTIHLVPGLWRPMSFFFTSYFGLQKMLKKYKYNVIICQCSIFGGFWAVRNHARIPVLVEIHEIFYFDYLEGRDLKSRLLKPIIRYSFEHASAVRSLNEKMTERLRANRIKNKKIFEVYNRVDMKLFTSDRKGYDLHHPIKLVSIGNFVESKDHINLFCAMHELKKNYDLELTLIGGGRLKEDYKKLIKEYGLNVRLIDRIPQSQMVEILNNADIYVHSSWSEGMPRVLLEAMAMKLPVIATAAGFTEGTIHNGDNGLVVPIKDSHKLAESIRLMIMNDDMRERMALRGYSDASEQYEWNKCFDRYRHLVAMTEGAKDYEL